MSFYQESKSARGAAIGTIMPWTGGLTDLPAGWLICDGQFVEAKDFPLLAQAIGDTYNAGTSDFDGNAPNSFPNYAGSIKLPNLNGKMLMDVETSYFGEINAGGTGRPADTDARALTLLSPLIGANEDNGVTTIFNDVFVDLVFNISPNDATGYQGRIKGNTLINGEGFKTVYVGPRKLGRNHIKRHNHAGSVETIDNGNVIQPGDGVVPYGTIYYTLFATAVDNDGSNDSSSADEQRGEIYYFGYTDDEGWKQDSPAESGNGNSNLSATYQGNDLRADVYGGIVAGRLSNVGATPSSANIVDTYTLQWPTSDILSGFGTGTAGTTVAKAHSEQPPINMKPALVTYSPLSKNFITNSTYNPNGKYIETSVPWGVGGNTVSIPPGYRNNYSENQATVGDTLISNPGINFTNNSASDQIFAHTHDEFDVTFDSSRMRPQSNLTVDVNLPNTVNLDNVSNKNALQIDFNIQQPRVTSIYIIRAY